MNTLTIAENRAEISLVIYPHKPNDEPHLKCECSPQRSHAFLPSLHEDSTLTSCCRTRLPLSVPVAVERQVSAPCAAHSSQ